MSCLFTFKRCEYASRSHSYATCTYTNMDTYLIKLRVESLFYDRCFVLGFLMNVWLEVPETEGCDTVTLSLTGCGTAGRNSKALMVQ